MATKEKKNEAVTIKKVRNLRKSIKIAWTQGSDEYDVNFHDNPLPSFLKAIAALGEHVCSLCELPASDVKKIVATGITCAENGENVLALIVAKKTIKKGKRVFNISTPLLSMYPDEENKTTDHMEKEQSAAIEKVISEATKYINGDRAQGQIEFEEESAGGKPEDGDKTEKFPGMTEPGA